MLMKSTFRQFVAFLPFVVASVLGGQVLCEKRIEAELLIEFERDCARSGTRLCGQIVLFGSRRDNQNCPASS